MSQQIAKYQRLTIGVYALRSDPKVMKSDLEAAEKRRDEVWNELTEGERSSLGAWLEWTEKHYGDE